MSEERRMIDPFVEKLVKKMFSHTACRLMVTMQEYHESLRFLRM